MLVFSMALSINAQKLNFRQGQVLVELKKGDTPRSTINLLQNEFGSSYEFEISQIIATPMNVWSISFDFARINERRLLEFTKGIREVYNAQFNHIIKQRKTPDDPLFEDQWQYINIGQDGGIENADLDIDDAWDITTGGLTISGDTIVACIIDDGIDPNHADFGNNLWINHGEIPDNNIDDDGNGYVDDYRGWDTYDESDEIFQGGSHGTSVAGIVGAKGNNGIGVAGVNWDVKLMIVRGGGDEAEALASYAYPYIMRKMYNDSDGAEGAFVVTTNASWGVNYGQPDEAPLWCNFYDSLGVVGIISCGATSNININIDEEGDLPTACSSDYLISVSNVTRTGEKETAAGYGIKSIDLGAFGSDVYTTSFNNQYSGFGGTSGATPHVTGAAALIYSMPHPELMELTKSNPAEAALLIKNIILNSVKKDAQFEDQFLSSGVLNMKNALSLVSNIFSDCPFPLVVETENLNLDSTQVTWESSLNANNYNLRYKLETDSTWVVVENASSPFIIDNLAECGMYEVQIQSFCDMDSSSDYSFSERFVSLGCCNAPGNLQYSNDPEEVSDNSILVNWNEDQDHLSYMVQYKLTESETWDTSFVDVNTITLEGLRFCSVYDIVISADCITGVETSKSDTLQAATSCGTCTTLDYCTPPDLVNAGEWIDTIILDNQVMGTGPDGGYMNYSGFFNIEVKIGTEIPFKLLKGFDGVDFDEWVKVWIDLDADGVFSEEELVFDEGEATALDIDTVIVVNGEFNPGFTLMRVGMVFDGEPTACDDPESFNFFGEYEDYCVELIGPCDYGLSIEDLNVQATEATVTFTMVDTSIAYNVRYRRVDETEDDWETISVIDTMATISPLDECTEYIVQVRAVCDIDTSGFMAVESNFTTKGEGCMVGTDDLDLAAFSFSAFPNPFVNELNINVQSEIDGPVDIEVINISGQVVSKMNKYLSVGDNKIGIQDSYQWSPGIYLIKLRSENDQKSAKVIKISN